MTEELDVVRFIRLQKQSRFAVKTIFSRIQLWLLQNQKMFVVNQGSDSSDARSDNDCPPHSERILLQEKDNVTFKKLMYSAQYRDKYIEQNIGQMTKEQEERQNEENNQPDLFRGLTQNDLQEQHIRRIFTRLEKNEN